MGADVLGFKAKSVLPHYFGIGTKCLEYIITGELQQFPFVRIGANGGVTVGFFVGQYSLDGKCQSSDWVEKWVVVVLLWNGNILFIVLLIFKCPGNCVCIGQLWIIVG